MESQELEQREILRIETISKFDEKGSTAHIYGKRFLTSRMDRLSDKMVRVLHGAVDVLFSDKPKGLFLMGGVGSGKTSFLYLLHKAIFERHVDTLFERGAFQGYETGEGDSVAVIALRGLDTGFITHMELISKLRKDPDEESYKTRRGLMVDDFGRSYEDAKGWNIAIQDEFFDYRWKNMLVTFLTSNYTPEDLRKMPGYERIVDRLADKDWITPIIMPGKSKRLENDNG